MIYGKVRKGDKWHIIVKDKVLCLQQSSSACISSIDSAITAISEDDRCVNCDNRLKDLGKTKKPKPKWKNPKTNYKPKNQVKW
jgi:hypothetical protein